MEIKKAREEEIKNVVAKEFFGEYDCTKIIGNIDFCVCEKPLQTIEQQDSPLVYAWGEAKRGVRADIYASFVQLILTIGRAKTFNKYAPPVFLLAFDAEKIAFVRWDRIQQVFSLNDFNWNITASDHESKYFKHLYTLIKENLEKESSLFRYVEEEKELRKFIKDNFKTSNLSNQKILIDKNNFYFVYLKWMEKVKQTISISWDKAKEIGILDADFYLADLISDKDNSLLENLRVVLLQNKYKLRVSSDMLGDLFREYGFTDNQKAYTQFWNLYERPPKQEYWQYIIDRRDRLVPQDFRERKGAFYTPQKWVELSQEYIAKVLGENWQEEYYVWDCAAGTGNLLNGLTEKYRIYASTLDMADVDVMKEKIKSDASNLLEEHVFQFDFLNDDFSKLPSSLQEIINDEEKRKRLVIYINPPYAEASTARTVTGTGENKTKVATDNKTYLKYKDMIGKASNEVFAQFFIRIHHEIPGCRLAEFSTLKILQAGNFQHFRNVFRADLQSLFLVPAKSFDNVRGDFPIGFFIWDTSKKKNNNDVVEADVYDKNGEFIGRKTITDFYGKNKKSLNEWIKDKDNKEEQGIAFMGNPSPDFQHCSQLYISIRKGIEHFNFFNITHKNIIYACIYFSVRLCIEATWLNDRDQFYAPNSSDWEGDTEFGNDCLTFTLFHGQNRITSKVGVNHWIPFKEEQVGARERYKSHFMIDFLNGKIKAEKKNDNNLFSHTEKAPTLSQSITHHSDLLQPNKPQPLMFSKEAQAVFDSAKELWKYYHSQKDSNTDASFYDIREYFQGRAANGRMNNSSTNEKYKDLLDTLRENQKLLAKKISQKVYAYGFLI